MNENRSEILIAIADDYPLVVEGLKTIIKTFSNCHVIIEAYNGKELIDKIRYSKTNPTICLLDLNMPIVNGYEVLEILKEEFPHIKVIVLSMHYNEFSIIKSINCGARACIPKESFPQDLLLAIQQVNNLGYYHTENVVSIVNNVLGKKNLANQITDQEIDFLKLCCRDLSYVEIAKEMNVSPRTVDGYRDRLFKKLDVKSRSALVMFAVQSGLVKI